MSFGGKDNGLVVGQVGQFLIGGLASMSAAVTTHPIDLIKVIHSDGVLGLYRGLSASLLRQATYSMTRFGAYAYIKNLLSDENGTPSAMVKMFSGILAGSIGAIVGNPADLTMVRMQADTRLPKSQRYAYKNVADGIIRIIREEGVLSLWRASELTTIRAMLVTAAQLGAYDQLKQLIVRDWKLLNDGILAHFLSSFGAGFIAAVVTNPVDLVKMRIMDQSKTNSLYKDPVDCVRKVVAEEGIMAFFKGFTPNFMRLGPQTIMTFIFYEQYVRLYHSINLKF